MVAAAREIENLIYRYAELLDDGELEAVADLFSTACIVAPDGSESRGREAVLAMYRNSTRIFPDTGNPATHHVTTNVQIEVDTDTATARSYFTVLQAQGDFALQPIITGRYHDEFRFDGQRWSFSRREMYPRLFGELGRHLLFDADTIK